MTNFLPGGPVSVGRIVSCPVPSQHPLVELRFADGGDFANVCDPILDISLPESLLGVDRALLPELNVCAG